MHKVRKVVSVAFVVAVALALAACTSTADHDHHDDHAHGAEGGRLLAVAADGSIAVLEAADGAVHALYPQQLPEGTPAAYAGPSGEFGYVVQRDASIVAVVDSGQILEEHDGHEDLEFGEVSIRGEIRSGALPTHFTTMVGRVGFYNDESGDITILDEGTIRSGLEYSLTPTRIDHGAPILLSDVMIVGYIDNPAVEIMDYEGTVIQEIPNVTRAHGQARVGRFSAIGAVEGVLVITQSGRRFDARMVPNPPGTPEDVRTGTLAAHPRLAHFVGNLGEGLVKIDPQAHTSTPFALPAAPWRFRIDRSGNYIVVLGQDGVVYVLDSDSFAVLGEVAAVDARDPDAPRGTPNPALTVGSGIAYLSDPATNRILEIHLDEAEIAAELPVPFDATLTSIALMVTDGVIH